MKKLIFRIVKLSGWQFNFSAALASCGLLLVLTNPTTEDYKDYAGHKLVEILTEELCTGQHGSMALALTIENCSNLIAQQHRPLSQFAERFSKRQDLVLFSIFSTRFGGKDFLPALGLPYFSVKTYAVAGRFVSVNRVIESGDD